MSNFKTDKFHLDFVMGEFLEKETQARMKDFDSCVKLGGRKVAATVSLEKGFVVVDVEMPVQFIEGE